MKKKAVFLDRDGTINVDKGFMEKYGHYLPYVLAILFLVFLMVMQ